MVSKHPREDKLLFRSRVRGCLLGGAIGDGLGAPIEFSSIDQIRQRYGPEGVTAPAVDGPGGVTRITDDTQMTLFTVEGLLRAHIRWTLKGIGGAVIPIVRGSYLRWLDTQRHTSPPPSDGPSRTGWLREQAWLYATRAPGNACLSGLDSVFTEPAPLGEPGPVNPTSKGCGAVMRSAPFGLSSPDPRHAFELAARCAQITHGHPTGYLAAGALAAMVNLLTRGQAPGQAVEGAMELINRYPAHQETTDALHGAVTLAAEGNPSPERVERLGGGWVAEEALAIAVYCMLVALPPAPVRGGGLGSFSGITSFQQRLLVAVNHSGDSDSTGAICGNLLGACDGELGVPAEWLVVLEGRATITELADDFASQLTEGSVIPNASDAWLRKYPGY